jgi:hypothetical protein
MSNSKIKLSEILKDRKKSENSFSSEHKKTELETQPPPKLCEPLGDKRLDNILNRLSKIKPLAKCQKPDAQHPKSLEYE